MNKNPLELVRDLLRVARGSLPKKPEKTQNSWEASKEVIWLARAVISCSVWEHLISCFWLVIFRLLFLFWGVMECVVGSYPAMLSLFLSMPGDHLVSEIEFWAFHKQSLSNIHFWTQLPSVQEKSSLGSASTSVSPPPHASLLSVLLRNSLGIFLSWITLRA